MPTFDDWKMKPPQFKDLADALTKCGNLVVKGIIGCVQMRLKPTGAPQKQNAPSTIRAKGHDHPVVERRGRFEKRSTYLVEPMDAMSVMISIASPADSEIAAHLHDQGYEFFGVTEEAEKRAYQIMEVYTAEELVRAAGGRPS